MTSRPGVLGVGDRVRLDGIEHTVVAIEGTSVRLHAESGHESVVMLSALLARSDFELIGAASAPHIEAIGLIEGLSADVQRQARTWERHIIEVVTGRAPDANDDALPRPNYDPSKTTLAERDAAKAAELSAAGTSTSARTIKRLRHRYAKEGLWGLVDHRATRPRSAIGRADPRVVAAITAAINAETDDSTGTRARLRRRVRARLDAEHGEGVVDLPSRPTFHRLVNALSTGKHTFESAVTRRQLANRPATPFTPTTASRPGEWTEIDTTPLDVMALLDDGVTARLELTMIVDIATRSIGAGILRPRGTKAVDAALLLGRMVVPEPMRPGWSEALAISRSILPHNELLDLDDRLRYAAAKPIIVPETIACDRGRVYLSETFTRACNRLGISLQPSHPYTPTDKGVVETTFGSINSLFCQYVAGYTSRNVDRRGRNVEDNAIWTLTELQELFDEWVISGWQTRPHDSLRDPLQPSKALSPNEMYAAMVAAAGYVPLALTGEDYIELLPVEWRVINAYGIRLNYRTYDCADLNSYRRQPSGVPTKGHRWEIHHDPYDLRQVWVRTPDGWVPAPWTHLHMVNAPFADFTWRHARELTAAKGRDPDDETAVAEALEDLLQRTGDPDETKKTRRVKARTTSATATPLHPIPPPDPQDDQWAEEPDSESDQTSERDVVLWEIFDAAEEAKRW